MYLEIFVSKMYSQGKKKNPFNVEDKNNRSYLKICVVSCHDIRSVARWQCSSLGLHTPVTSPNHLSPKCQRLQSLTSKVRLCHHCLSNILRRGFVSPALCRPHLT